MITHDLAKMQNVPNMGVAILQALVGLGPQTLQKFGHRS